MTHTKNRQIKRAFEDWKKATATELWHVYGRFSQAKVNAMEYCKSLMEKHNGYGLRIVSHNLNVFTVGFLGEIDGKEAFFYITRDYDRFATVDELNG